MNTFPRTSRALIVCAVSLAAVEVRADCPTPPNLKEGAETVFYVAAVKPDGMVRGKVEKIDRANCWAKVRSTVSGGQIWVNLRQIEMISTPPERY
jgi:hypothetical protein